MKELVAKINEQIVLFQENAALQVEKNNKAVSRSQLRLSSAHCFLCFQPPSYYLYASSIVINFSQK